MISIIDRLKIAFIAALQGLTAFCILLAVYLPLEGTDWLELVMLFTYSILWCWLIMFISGWVIDRLKPLQFLAKLSVHKHHRSVLYALFLAVAALGLFFTLDSESMLALPFLGISLILCYAIALGVYFRRLAAIQKRG